MTDERDVQLIDRKQVRRMYVILSTLSIIIMIIAAYITYGHQEQVVTVNIPAATTQQEQRPKNALTVGADLSQLPSEVEIERILNNNLPHTCKDCDDDPLECLDKYTINKILVQEKQYQNQLFIELLTGKESQKYTVVIDLAHDNTVINAFGSIDKKECILEEENEEGASGDEVMLNDGIDPNSSTYIQR